MTLDGIVEAINEHIQNRNSIKTSYGITLRPVESIKCKNGLVLSVQGSAGHYCRPREDTAGFYYEVEVGFPSEHIELLMPYAETPEEPTNTVYGWVPITVVAQVVKDNGGLDI